MIKKRLKASELVAILQKKIAKYGDLAITIKTEDGSYSLPSEDYVVEKKVWTGRDGSKIATLDIGR